MLFQTCSCGKLLKENEAIVTNDGTVVCSECNSKPTTKQILKG